MGYIFKTKKMKGQKLDSILGDVAVFPKELEWAKNANRKERFLKEGKWKMLGNKKGYYIDINNLTKNELLDQYLHLATTEEHILFKNEWRDRFMDVLNTII